MLKHLYLQCMFFVIFRVDEPIMSQPVILIIHWEILNHKINNIAPSQLENLS